MNCDRIARAYRFLEYAAFGRALERHRFVFLPRLEHCRSALLLGDGDGRFAAHLLESNPEIQVESVDLSAKMLKLSAARVPGSGRVRWIQADARQLTYTPDKYDLVVANFFFDCLNDSDTAALIRSLRGACAPGCLWVVTEFAVPRRGWRRVHAAASIAAMYLFFRLATGLGTRRIPDYAAHLAALGFALRRRWTGRAGLISSDLWSRITP